VAFGIWDLGFLQMPSAPEAPFQHIAIVGLGLIGGSIALAVRERWPAVRIVAIDRPPVIAHALGSGAIDRGAESVSGIRQADLVILAAPVRQNVAWLETLATELPESTIVTDVGGTKRDIVAAARALPLSRRFVGGHPIGGAERGGFGFARPDLFRGRPWIFTPHGAAAESMLDRLFALVAGVGARPLALDAEQHDRVMAYLSHLPQLTASALMATVGAAAGADGLKLAGRGLVDTTRLASSPPDTWRDVCAANADVLADALDALIARLAELRADLRSDTAVTRMFADAARWRAELMKGRE
jgi:prephenate dehydrogenase